MSSSLGRNALDILYYDCWVEVFKKLEPDDYPSLSNVCQPFRQILNNSHYGFCEGEWKFDVILPRLLSYLECEVILKSRLICKSWLDSIDTLLEERDDCPPLIFRRTERVAEFIERFGDSNPSGILLRRVWLREDLDEEGDAYEKRAMEFMQMFGDRIWELEVRARESTFLQLLPFTPNLKSFEYLSEDGGELEPLLEDLPDLPRLKRFSTFPRDDVAVHHFLQKYGAQLEDLKYYGMEVQFTDLSLEENGINSQTFGALKILDILAVGIRANIFTAFQSLNCPLELLMITIMDYNNENLFEIDLFLRSINHLQELRTLSIRTGHTIRISESGWLLPEEFENNSITHLELDVDFGEANPKKGNISFNFLESLGRLESLSLNYNLDTGEGKVCHVGMEKRIDLFDGVSLKGIWNKHQLGFDHAYKSDVWEKVESLEKVELSLRRPGLGTKCFCFNREKYNDY